MLTNITRRAALVGAFASSAAVAVVTTRAFANGAQAEPFPPVTIAAGNCARPEQFSSCDPATIDAMRDWVDCRRSAEQLFAAVLPEDRVNPMRPRANGRISGPSWWAYCEAADLVQHRLELMLRTIDQDSLLRRA